MSWVRLVLRHILVRRILGALLIVYGPPAILAAQDWNSPRALELAQRATQRRSSQLADTALRNYKAEARGYLSFLVQLGEGFGDTPRLVRTDQIVSDLYWKFPDVSRQYIKGRRDTLLLPTDINYHRDHLGIIQNNFPDIIRLGDGDEVEDVPHPLSPKGMPEYDFAIRDSLEIRLGATQTISVYEVRVRPKNDRAPRAIGSIYVDRDRADVVRMTLSFTRVALKDQDLEDVTVVLENGLIEGRFWLPRRQEIEIRRTGSWLDYPVRGIIRGWWEIDGFDVNVSSAEMDTVYFGGPEIQAIPGSRVTMRGMVTSSHHTFQGSLLDSLPPDVRIASDAEIRRVQEEAREIVRAQALVRGQQLALSSRGVSDFVRFNRVEGIAAGAGLSRQLGHGMSVMGAVHYGFSDREIKARARLSHTRANGATISVAGYRTLADVADFAERSGLFNTFAAQEFGSDYTNLYFTRGVTLHASTSTHAPIRGVLQLAHERHDSVSVHARPVRHSFLSTLAIPAFRETRLTLGTVIPRRSFGTEQQSAFNAELFLDGIRGKVVEDTGSYGTWLRATARMEFTRRFGSQMILSRTLAAGIVGGDRVPVQHLVYMGGPTTAPGYEFHALRGRGGVSQRVEWQFGIPFVGVPLGAWGKAPARLTLAPYVNGTWMNGMGWKPSVGVGVLSLFDLIRFDVAHGTRDGRWWFGVDVSREFWGVL